MLTENITFVLGRVTPVKYKDFGSNSFPNSVVRQYIVALTWKGVGNRGAGHNRLVVTKHVGLGLDGNS